MRDSPNFQRSLMTESVAEPASKLLLSPKPAAISALKTPDKPEAAATADESKPAPEALTPTPGGGHFVFGLLGGKKQTAVLASAVFSLIAGIAGVRLLLPTSEENNSAQAPTQQLAGDSKQATNPASGPTVAQEGNKPPSGGILSANPAIPLPPQNGIPQPALQTPPSPANFGLNNNKPTAHYMITDQVLASLRSISVPDNVLMGFVLVKNKDLSLDEMEKEISYILTPLAISVEDKTKYQGYILYYAKKPDSPVPTPTGSTGLTGATPPPAQIPAPVMQIGGPNVSVSPPAPSSVHYLITDQTIVSLRVQKLPDILLQKLSLLKGKEMLQAELEKELGWLLSADEKRQYQTSIEYYAKVAETTPRPSSAEMPAPSLNLPSPQPVPTITTSSSIAGTSPVLNPSRQPEAPIVPGAPIIPSQPANLPVPQLPSAALPLPELSVSPPQPAAPTGPGKHPPHDQFGPAGSYTHTEANAQTTQQTSTLPQMPAIPAFSPGPIVPVAGQEAPKIPSANTVTMPPVTGNPIIPSPQITAPISPTPPVTGTNPIPTPGFTLPVPMVEVAPRLPTPSTSPTTAQTSPMGGTLPTPATIVPPNAQSTTSPIVPVAPPELNIPRHPSNSIFPPDNAAGTTGTVGTTLNMSKPPSSPPPTPNTSIERTPTTSYDVDLYEPKQGDTWESISREFYNDTRFAAALRSVNQNKPLTSGGTVDIPPLYILKQKYQTPTRTAAPSSQSSPIATSAPTWGAPASTTSQVATSGGGQIYRVPAGGTSMREIAKTYLGNEQRWMEIYNLNPSMKPDEVPAGTDVRLPADARLPK